MYQDNGQYLGFRISEVVGSDISYDCSRNVVCIELSTSAFERSSRFVGKYWRVNDRHNKFKAFPPQETEGYVRFERTYS